MKLTLVFALRIIIGLSFIVSGLTKIFALSDFIWTVFRFNVLPFWAIYPFSALLPPIELTLGVSMILGVAIRFTSLSISALLLMMLTAILPQLLGGPKIEDCGCFGGLLDSAVDLNLVFRDITMFAATYFIFIQNEHYLPFNTLYTKITNTRARV